MCARVHPWTTTPNSSARCARCSLFFQLPGLSTVGHRRVGELFHGVHLRKARSPRAVAPELSRVCPAISWRYYSRRQRAVKGGETRDVQIVTADISHLF